jgi:hypothetical protein
MKNIQGLILNVLNENVADSQSPIERLATYLKEKPLDFNNQPLRTSFSNYISEMDMDELFEYFADFPDFDKLVTDPKYAEQYYNDLPLKVKDEFKDMFNTNSLPEGVMANDILYDPTYKVLQFKRIIKNAKIVRFVNDRRFKQVMKDGFVNMGYNNIDILGVTKYFEKSERSPEGYLYGYEANSPEAKKQAKLYGYGQGESYGDNVIFLVADAVEVYHNKDNETQIIFWTGDVDPSTMTFGKGVEGSSDYIVIKNGENLGTATYDEIVKSYI